MYPEGFPGLAPTSRTKSLEEFTSSPALIHVMVGNATLPPLFTRYTLAPHDANSERGEWSLGGTYLTKASLRDVAT
jgi:hypothetical protein